MRRVKHLFQRVQLGTRLRLFSKPVFSHDFDSVQFVLLLFFFPKPSLGKQSQPAIIGIQWSVEKLIVRRSPEKERDRNK